MAGFTGFMTNSSRDAGLGVPFETEWCELVDTDAAAYLNGETVAIADSPTTFVAADFLVQPDVARNLIIDVTAITDCTATFQAYFKDHWDNPLTWKVATSSVQTLIGVKQAATLQKLVVTLTGDPATGTVTFDFGNGNVFGLRDAIGHEDDIKYALGDCLAVPLYNGEEGLRFDVPNQTWENVGGLPTAPFKLIGQSTKDIIGLNGSLRNKPGFLAP